MIDVSAQPCAPKDCPLGPVVHEQEELEAPTPSTFPVIATQPGGLMVVREGQVGGGCWKVAGRVAGRGSSAGRVCWKGA